MKPPNPSGLCLCGCGRVTPIARSTSLRHRRIKGEHARFYDGVACANRLRTGFATTEARFWSYVDRGSADACWPWLGYITENGQGQFSLTKRVRVLAHRYAYELTHGPISDGLTLDHLCHTNDPSCHLGRRCPHRSCVNPAHLEPVSPRTNVLRAHTAPTAINARKTHCIRGHEFAGSNLLVSMGRRYCRECRRERSRAQTNTGDDD